MLSTSLVTLALAASTVLALPAPTFFDGTLVKRQNDGIEGLRSLAQRATAGQSNGQCRDQCGPWITVFSACAGFSTDVAVLGGCACAVETARAMDACETCFDDDVNDFEDLCRRVAAPGAGGSSSSFSGSAALPTASSVLSSSTNTSTRTRSCSVGTGDDDDDDDCIRSSTASRTSTSSSPSATSTRQPGQGNDDDDDDDDDSRLRSSSSVAAASSSSLAAASSVRLAASSQGAAAPSPTSGAVKNGAMLGSTGLLLVVVGAFFA